MERIKLKDLYKSSVEFIDATHCYVDGEKNLEGITSTLIPLAYPHTYDKPEYLTDDQWAEILANAAKKGTAVHEDIQNYCEKGDMPQLPEGFSWTEAEKQYNIEWVANEYLVTDNIGLASKIDILAYVDGCLSIIDIKRTSEIHYDTVTLQTSIYKDWFEKMNPGLKIEKCFIFWAREDKWKLIELSVIEQDELNKLYEAYYSGATEYEFNPLPRWCNIEKLEYLSQLMRISKETEEKIKALKKEISENMILYHHKGFEGCGVKINYIAPTKVQSFDKTAFGKAYPEILANFTKEKEKEGYITITQK